MNIALVDDDAQVIEGLEEYVDRYFRDREDAYHIFTFRDGMDILNQYRPIYDIIFMDINMQLLDGLKTARKLRELDEKVVLIFITNLAKYAVRGYEVNALDFMIKPLKYEHFVQNMKKAEKIIARYQNRNVLINTEDGMKVIAADDIYYVEVLNHTLQVNTKDQKYEARGSISKLREHLPADSFALCNRCYLVNLRHVTSIAKDEVVVGSYQLKMSRAKKKEFVLAVTEYFGGTY